MKEKDRAVFQKVQVKLAHSQIERKRKVLKSYDVQVPVLQDRDCPSCPAMDAILVPVCDIIDCV